MWLLLSCLLSHSHKLTASPAHSHLYFRNQEAVGRKRESYASIRAKTSPEVSSCLPFISHWPQWRHLATWKETGKWNILSGPVATLNKMSLSKEGQQRIAYSIHQSYFASFTFVTQHAFLSQNTDLRYQLDSFICL